MNRSLALSALVLVCATALLVASISLIATPGALAASIHPNATGAVARTFSSGQEPICTRKALICRETRFHTNYEGEYIGHDEPLLTFFSGTAGAGNSNIYSLILPKDPPTLPKQDGSGGTYNFELHPTFWFGMVLCDTQSYPEFTNTCTPDSDANIFSSKSGSDPGFVGHHPGGAYLELQFYPPGWAPWPDGISCDATKWCAALNIDSFLQNGANGKYNNNACNQLVDVEPVNFAFVTKNGVSQVAADPVTGATNPAQFTPDANKDFFMNSGDNLSVDIHDTPDGLTTIINDLTTSQSGSMTASTANGFAQIKYDPNGTGCTVLPYAFHPMYSTASKKTFLPWAAGDANVAFSDEIGHFEFCSKVNNNGKCTGGGDGDKDDKFCLSKDDSLLVKIGGCLDTDVDWDGTPYQLDWPGTLTDPKQDRKIHPQPVVFTSPTLTNGGNQFNYSKVAFETDLPALEEAFHTNACSTATGLHCTNPPTGAKFYPIYSTKNNSHGDCEWQFGGAHIAKTTNNFGGTPAAAYGNTFATLFQTGPSTAVKFYGIFRHGLKNNPCPAVLP